MLAKIGFIAVIGLLSTAAVLNGALAPRPADAAAQIAPLTFSSEMTDKFEPVDARIEFSGDNNGVFVTFTFTDLPPGKLTRIVRFNGEDYNWDSDQHGHLNCCGNGGSGRYGFPVVRRSTGQLGDLPGGAYGVFLYYNGTEMQRGGFGIRGEGGGDSDSQNGGNGNG